MDSVSMNYVHQDESESSTTMGVKICRVCGDRALGFNFNGLTCESCKSFFRRNARRWESYTCRKDGNCPIDFVTRKCCTRCRLDKCFAIGMRKELICSKLSVTTTYDNNNPSPNQSLAQQSHTEDCIVSGKSLVFESSSSALLSPPPLITSLHSPSPSTSHSSCSYGSTTSSSSAQPSSNHCSKTDTILEQNIRSHMSACNLLFPLRPEEIQLQSSSTNKSKAKTKHSKTDASIVALNSAESEILSEIEKATEAAAFYDENRLQVIGEVTDLIYALNLAELYIRKTIKFCKAIAGFRWLSQEDQLIVLKGFFTELMIVRFAFVFNPEKDGYPVIEDEARKQAVFIKLNLLYEAKKQNVLLYCRQYSIRFHTELEDDSTIRDLILAQRLFKPREGLSCPEFISYQQSLYHRLLTRYLELKYKDQIRAEEKMTKLSTILNEMAPVKEILEGLFIQSDVNQLALVLSELYNLR